MGIFRQLVSKGQEYTVTLSAHFKVFVRNRDTWKAGDEKWLAEEEAWNIVEDVLKYVDPKEYNIWGVTENNEADGGYEIGIKVDFEIFVVDFDVDEAYNKAVDVVDNLELPDNARITLIEQIDPVEVGEPVYMVVGE